MKRKSIFGKSLGLILTGSMIMTPVFAEGTPEETPVTEIETIQEESVVADMPAEEEVTEEEIPAEDSSGVYEEVLPVADVPAVSNLAYVPAPAQTLASESNAAINVAIPMIDSITPSTDPVMIPGTTEGLVKEDTPYTGTLNGSWTAADLFADAYSEYLKNESFAGPRVIYNEAATKDSAPLFTYTIAMPADSDVEITEVSVSETAATIAGVKATVAEDRKSVTIRVTLPWVDYQQFFTTYLTENTNPDAALKVTVQYAGTAKAGSTGDEKFTGTGYGSFWYYKTFLGMVLDREVMHFSDSDGGRGVALYRVEKALPQSANATYKVVNGTWEDGTTDDITEEIAFTDGKGNAVFPTGMKPDDGYYGGSWNPVSSEMTEDAVFTYTFAKMNQVDAVAETTLSGNILINDNADYEQVYSVTHRNKEINLTGVLDLSKVKTQMAEIETAYGKNAAESDIVLKGLDTEYTGVLTLPEELDFVDTPEAYLAGANGKFEIVKTEVSDDRKTITVTMKPSGDIRTFADLKETLNGAEDTLRVNLSPALANESMQYNTVYTVDGSFTGYLRADAEYAKAGKKIRFDLTWNAVQDETVRTTGNLIRDLTYVRREMNAEGNEVLEGDIRIKEETQHTDVYSVSDKADVLEFTCALNIRPVKEQLAEIEKQYGANTETDKIILNNLETSYIAYLTLPEELDYKEPVTAILTGANGSFEVTDTAVSEDGKTVAVTMKPSRKIGTFEELKEILNASGDHLEVTIRSVVANEQAEYNANYTVLGSFKGNLSAEAEDVTTGNVLNVVLNWTAKQTVDGADSTNPDNLDTIRFTLRYKAPKMNDVPDENDLPKEPSVSKKPNPSVAKTGIGEGTTGHTILMTGALLAVLVLMEKRKKA